ncbi:tRNA (5-methylaminomethyl-2-thiouridine)(34)-methyltransferase MnmD [Roseinatronobacter alkalisoli]|uniref:tRNA (5-methylaminomethyl-2-thiouridine)(34)-methyltransferase MnmD n=1 Tax=Roseinatronobacter alkalisoli TaxID=3028235 RepID=A0ABT5T760_9RHOB|nr:tRNA (5-methylaminomethyl-2-thiouridine)(34)-methyltransferase MnmD [Roseinatronobacter sp. HJB301]MDD7970052.1 tRNA (5-methylaminomethyl-2-thiouridine)(34)-methyltransferase MnmD [Roseinatronobacter sp. HJB301]
MNNQNADITWKDNQTPVATRFDDPYFSLADGLAETQHVFLAGNRITQRAAPGFHIAELGFGTGLNLLATAQALAGRSGPVYFTSFEAYPMHAADMARALAPFTGLDTAPLLAAWSQGLRQFTLGSLQVEIVMGDARDTLPLWQGKADAWYLDGFSPAKNPELWTDTLMAQVATHTRKGGTFATYTAAGAVRRALATAGFDVIRQPGFAHKRHMTTGTLS